MMPTFIRKNLRQNWHSHAGRFLVCALVMSVCGCVDSVQERGWIGGEYRVVNSFPKDANPRPAAGLLLVASSTHTPVYAAGLRAGDVVLEVNHKPIKHLQSFRSRIDAFEPGTVISVSALHDGKTLDCAVTVGRETFNHNGNNISLDLPSLPGEWNLIPTADDPSFSLGVLGYEPASAKRAELGSVKNSYLRETNPEYKVVDDGWRCWIAILRISTSNEILKQEQVSK